MQQSALEVFDVLVAIKCGPGETVEDFDELVSVETPYYNMCRDDTTDSELLKASPEDLDPTLDAEIDHYLNVSVVLPRGDKFSRGKVIGRKRDCEGNPIGRDNAQPDFVY